MPQAGGSLQSRLGSTTAKVRVHYSQGQWSLQPQSGFITAKLRVQSHIPVSLRCTHACIQEHSWGRDAKMKVRGEGEIKVLSKDTGG